MDHLITEYVSTFRANWHTRSKLEFTSIDDRLCEMDSNQFTIFLKRISNNKLKQCYLLNKQLVSIIAHSFSFVTRFELILNNYANSSKSLQIPIINFHKIIRYKLRALFQINGFITQNNATYENIYIPPIPFDKCVVCSEILTDPIGITLCHKCTNICINKKIAFVIPIKDTIFNRTYRRLKYVYIDKIDDNKGTIYLDEMIHHSNKLINRYFHKMLLIMSSNILLPELVLHIVQFIYYVTLQ